MKDHSTGQYNILWVLSALSQMCSGIRSDESPLLQVFNAIRKVLTHRQKENQPASMFREEFVQTARAMRTFGTTITLPAACLELEAKLDPSKTLSDDVKQARAFERLMALTYLNQCDNSVESTRIILKTQFVQDQENYPANITGAVNLIRAAKKEKSNSARTRPALTLAQRATNSAAASSTTHHPSAEYFCTLCGAHDQWQLECPRSTHNGGDLQPIEMVSVEHIVSPTQNNSIKLS